MAADSVSSQADAEQAAIERERKVFATDNKHEHRNSAWRSTQINAGQKTLSGAMDGSPENSPRPGFPQWPNA